MSAPDFYADGQKLKVGQRVGRGGEGEVFALADGSNRALKHYTAVSLADRQKKIAAMIKQGLAAQTNLVAFPTSAVQTKNGAFAGFLMKLVQGHKPLHELYAPKARKQNFPSADYRFLVRAATNIARAVASVHDVGCVIGDINHSGILVSDKAVAALIDADSFQVDDGTQRHLCVVGVPEYTAPELQGRSLSGVVRTPAHDAFGLAVIIFQLLFMGRHPFAGRYASGEISMEEAIGQGRFVYSQRRNVGMTPPPGVPTLNDFPPDVRDAFERAFAKDPQQRPTAKAWVSILADLEKGLSRCAKFALHHYPSQASECPWCRMENKLGLVLFQSPILGSPVGTVSDPGAANFRLDSVWAQILAVTVPTAAALNPPLATLSLEPSSDAKEVRRQHNLRRFLGIALIAGPIVGGMFISQIWFIWMIIAGFGLNRLLGEGGAFEPFRRRQTAIADNWEPELDKWRRRCGLGEIFALRAKLEEARRDYAGLDAERAARLAAYQNARRSIHLERFLESHLIRRANLTGIGPSKQATLASYGIETAADIDASKIHQIHGFGPVLVGTLEQWRRQVTSRFVYNPNPTPQDRQETDRIHAEMTAKASALRVTLTGGARELSNAVQQMQVRAKASDPALNKLWSERQQLEIDLEYLGIKVPPKASRSSGGAALSTWQQLVKGPAPIPSPIVAGIASSPSSGVRPPVIQTPVTSTSCPNCGSRMVRRTAKRGHRAGRAFWGCSQYPSCRGTRPI